MEERNHAATFEAYDGVELRLLNGRVVRCPALTVREAVRYLRLLSRAATDAEAHADFMAEFPARMGITGERLADLGLEVEGLDLGALSFRDGVRLANVLAVASYHMDSRKRARAQLAFLRLFPRKLGLDGSRLEPAHVYALGRRFSDGMYQHIYGLAQDFCSLLTSGPAVRTMVLTGAQPTATDPRSTQDSTT